LGAGKQQMSIEIKQLVIKSTIADDYGDDDRHDNVMAAELKEDLLGECRRLVLDLLDEKGLR
jgi:hypothetical protein